MKRQFLAGAIAILSVAAIHSCKKEENKLPPIGGFNTADEVAASNLVAYLPLNGTATESKSNTAAANVSGVSWVPGVKGQAAKFDKGYVVFPSTTAYSALNSFTISSWVQIKNNGATPSMLFQLARDGEWAGTINLMAETGWRKETSDTLPIKGLLVENRGGNANWQDCINKTDAPSDPTDVQKANKVAGTSWFHALVRYDPTTSQFTAWVNGERISNPTWEVRRFNGNPMGNITLYSPNRIVLGGFYGKITGASQDAWQQNMVGQLDEVRLYSKALTDAEITALYQLEKAGR